MNPESKKLIDSYIKALLDGDAVLLSNIGDLRSKLSEEDKPYFRKQYLANSEKIEKKRTTRETKLQQTHNKLIEELLIRH
ncbi:MAG: hypothetical protein JWN78_2644 [Bacteroidota bacterium]|nr:hypothetical protein [Bacteroidota bacterium]